MGTSTAVRSSRDAGTTDDRDPVLDAALAAFLDFGIRRTSMGEIARRALISPATLYRRYAAKSDVVMAVGLREARRDIAAVDARVDTAAPPAEQLTQMYLEVSRRVRGNRLLRRVLDTEPETVLPRLTLEAGPLLDIGRSYLADFLVRLQREGHVPAYDVTPVVDWLARHAQSETLTPAASAPSEKEVRDFVHRHLAPFVGITPGGGTR